MSLGPLSCELSYPRHQKQKLLWLNYHDEESFLNGVVKRRVAGRVNHVDLGPVLEQDLQDGQVAAVAGQVDGHLALVVLRVEGEGLDAAGRTIVPVLRNSNFP